jgi:hypothetical protein
MFVLLALTSGLEFSGDKRIAEGVGSTAAVAECSLTFFFLVERPKIIVWEVLMQA